MTDNQVVKNISSNKVSTDVYIDDDVMLSVKKL